MAMLMSFVNRRAPGIAREKERHLPASLCKVFRSVWLLRRMELSKSQKIFRLFGKSAKACLIESTKIRDCLRRDEDRFIEANEITQSD